MTDTGIARCAHTRTYRDQKDALHNQLEAAGHAVALTRALRAYLTEKVTTSHQAAATLPDLLGKALGVDPELISVGMGADRIQIRVR